MISNREKKYIKSLQIKKYRQQHQAFLVEGWKSVAELLDSDLEIELLFISDKYKNLCNGTCVSSKEINTVSSLANNNEAIAVVKMPKKQLELDSKQPIFVFDGIQDPGNLGTILRTADWLGFTNIVCSTDSVDFYNPKVISSTKGSFLRIDPHYIDLESLINDNNERQILLADLDGEDYKDIKYDNNCIIIFGGESKGVRDNLRAIVNNKLTIPKRGEAESLNVAMSFGIVASFL